MGLLDGKVALITGAGNGIGRAHALSMAKEGAKVIVNDLGGARDVSVKSQNAADAVVSEIKDDGGEAVANYDNVTSFEGAQKMVWTAVNKFSKLDIVVNNAGILRDKTLLNMTESEFDAVIDVHLKGSYLVMQAAARQMKQQGHGGRIINTSSVSGLIGNFGQGNYGAAKAGIYGMTRVAAIEFARMKVTVNAIAPVAYTRMTEDLGAFKEANEEDLGPQHIAPLVSFLASEMSEGITGKVFGVEGRKLFEYKMETNEGMTKPEGLWTPEEIQESLGQILSS